MKTIPFNKFNSFYLKNKTEILTTADEVLSSGKYIREENIKFLEKKLTEICCRKYALTTSSCTDAIFFSLKAAGIKPGDEVILPSFSYIASLSPILMCGAIPVFADINSQNLMLDIDKIGDLITEKTKAIIFIQLFGNIKDLVSLKKLCVENNLILIEDAAQALGTKNGAISGGSYGDLSCISFDPTKIVSAFGTGGVVLTDDEKYYKKLCKLIHHGRNSNEEFEILGYNSKIPALNAAIINLQLDCLDETVRLMNEKADRYSKGISNISQIRLISKEKNTVSTYHKFVILADNRNGLKKHLTENGIETRIHYETLLHEHKLMKEFPSVRHDLSNSKSLKLKVISLPIYPDLENDEIDYICECIKTFYKL
jgi:dTDP-4-amino-4,6-dideoxygalactose transaminase